MSTHLVAYMKGVLTGGTLGPITPVPDPTVTQTGTLMYVPAKYNKVVATAALCTYGTAARAQLQAPSMRELFFPDISPVVIGTSFGADHSVDHRGSSPLQAVTNEGMEFFSDAGGDGTTAGNVYGLIWLSDGPVTPIKGDFRTVRATSAIQASATDWVDGPLVLSQTLPVGTYEVVGIRAMAAGLVAARLIYIGSGAVTRPGVPGQPNDQAGQMTRFVGGQFGSFGTFSSVNLPSVEVLGGTTPEQSFEIDLIKTA